MVGFPRNLHALYVEQLEGTNAALSVLDTVMQADKEVQTWRQQAALLQVAPFHHGSCYCVFMKPPSYAATFACILHIVCLLPPGSPALHTVAPCMT